VSVKCCTGHGRVFQGEHWSTQWALHPQIRIRCWLQRRRLDQWHCCSQAVEMIDNHGTQYMSVQLVAAVYHKIKMLWLSHVALSMAGCFKVGIQASNDPCIHKSACNVACRDGGWISGIVGAKLWKWYTIKCMSVQLVVHVMISF